ncbi:hypothetical protein EYF80_063768 [Liparis tanakae]|uniref:Uncharacterized protein n=1 Tax=Liparis tanakae TaxID=230148 RepID=A0A4Z2EBG9_9TELE|nr:hypothetical protein EYF80_063768 [Liparis tanakae]
MDQDHVTHRHHTAGWEEFYNQEEPGPWTRARARVLDPVLDPVLYPVLDPVLRPTIAHTSVIGWSNRDESLASCDAVRLSVSLSSELVSPAASALHTQVQVILTDLPAPFSQEAAALPAGARGRVTSHEAEEPGCVGIRLHKPCDVQVLHPTCIPAYLHTCIPAYLPTAECDSQVFS